MAMQNRRYINKMRRDAIGRSYRAGKKCGSYTESDIPPDASDICDSAADDEKTVQPEPKPPPWRSLFRMPRLSQAQPYPPTNNLPYLEPTLDP
mgnify:CR=1 FL=1